MEDIAERDISTQLIPQDSIRSKLPAIFSDSIFTDTCFNITLVSQSILELLEFSDEELSGKSLNYISGKVNIVSGIKKALHQGYFEGEDYCFYSKHGQPLYVKISGFYLGLISDISHRIVLTIKQLKNQNQLLPRLHSKQREVDNFIYRVSHDLRGPLATIKGLVNLLKIREDDADVDHLVQLIDAHANKMDERLFHLVYLSKCEQVLDDEADLLNFSSLETHLRKILEKNAFIDFLELHFSSPKGEIRGVSESQVALLFENLLMHIMSSGLKRMNSQISYKLSIENNLLNVVIAACGFKINDYFIENQTISFTYTDLIKYPQMVNFFTARKIAEQLSASLIVNGSSGHNQYFEVSIPLATD